MKNNLGKNKLFLFFMVIIYLLIYFINPVFFEKVFTTFSKIFLEIYWVIILVFILSFVLNLFLSEKKIIKYLGKESGLKGWSIAIFAGLISHGASYLWFPILKDFKEKGMKEELISVFLYNKAIKLPLLPLMVFYFGFVLTLVLSVELIIFSVISALFLKKWLD